MYKQYYCELSYSIARKPYIHPGGIRTHELRFDFFVSK
jgi:hypothetical protein